MAPAKLARYQSMRDFGKTAEPSGRDAKVKSSNAPRFVIQRHAATRLHYDLRLEYQGVFKSWAVTRGPSFDPADKRLAVEVEDHPLDYGDFEGTIPKGQYGGGTVQLWDRGYWAPEPAQDIAKALKKGDLKLVMEGERMHGSWALVRMRRRPDEKRDNWLLIKHHDEFAVEGEAGAVTEDQFRGVRPLHGSDRRGRRASRPAPFMTASRASAAADAVWRSRQNANSTAAAARPEVHEAAQRPSAGHRVSLHAQVHRTATDQAARPAAAGSTGWAHEIKFDGYRMQMRVEAGQARLFIHAKAWTGPRSSRRSPPAGKTGRWNLRR